MESIHPGLVNPIVEWQLYIDRGTPFFRLGRDIADRAGLPPGGYEAVGPWEPFASNENTIAWRRPLSRSTS